MDPEAGRLLNVSLRYVRGKSFLLFIGEQRVEFVKAMRSVPSCGVPARGGVIRPREKRPVAATIELRQHPDGIEWVISVSAHAVGS
jgi:hypothetical protein